MKIKNVTMKALSVIMAMMMMLGVCAPAIGAAADDHAHGVNELADDYAEELAAIADLIASAEEAYAPAYEQALAEGKIAEAIAYIDEAIAGLNTAIEAVENYSVDAEFAAVKAELINELENTVETLNTLNADLEAGKFATTDKAAETLLSYEAQLNKHLATLKALAMEIGFVADPYIADLVDAINGYVALATDMIASACERIVATVRDSFNTIVGELKAEIQHQIAILEGYIAELEAYLAELEAALNEMKAEIAELTAEIRAKIAAVEAKIAEIKAEIAEIKADIIALTQAIKDGIATIEDAVEMINALVADVKCLVEFVENFEIDFDFDLEIPSVEEIKATLASLIDLEALAEAVAEKVCTAVKTALTSLAQALLDQIRSDVSCLVDGIVSGVLDIINGIVSDTTDFITGIFTDDYTITADSYYVAITGANSAYADLLAETLGVASGKQTWGALDFDDLAKADLITVGYDVAEVNSFAVNQVLAYAAELLNGEVRTSAVAYAETVANLMLADTVLTDDAIAEYVAEIKATLNDAADAALASEFLAGKTLESMDWASVIGAEKLALVEQALIAAEAELTAAGIPATYTYEFDVVDFIFNNTDVFGAELADVIAGFDKAEIYTKLGDKAYYAVEIPAAEVALLAVESFLYCNVTFQAELAATMATLAEINPDAAIAVLGQYNTFDGLTVELGEISVCLGDAYDVVAKLASAHILTYAIFMPNVIYVDVAGATDAADADAYIAEQILNAYTVTCAHSWIDATCTDAKTCALCGETEGDALGHTWTDATCTDAKTCSVCGTTEGDALGHKWTDATCTDAKTCSVCGTTEGEALGHTWTDATCTDAKTCSVCGTTEGEALGHTYANDCDADCDVCGETRTPADHVYGEWTVVTEATKKAEGKQERTCSVCGNVESEAIPQLEGCASVLSTLTVIFVTLLGAGLVIRKKED